MKTVVDLRTNEELEADPPAELPVEVLHIPFLETDRSDWKQIEGELDTVVKAAPDVAAATRDVYLVFLEHYAPNVAAAVRAVANAPEGGVVIHCAGGKDRTGLVTAFLLHLAGVGHGRDRQGLRVERGASARASRAVDRPGRVGRGARAARAHLADSGRFDAGASSRSSSGATAASRATCATEASLTTSSLAPARGCVTDTVLAIFGPTGSGKSAVAEALAERIPAEIVSADSMQLYRGLPILTNQSPARLVGIWPLDHEASVAEYQALAHAAIDEILAAGRTPIVAGGTGLYLRAALSDLSLPPAPEPGERERWEQLYDTEGPEQAHAQLAELDPEAAAAVHPNDRRRVVRSLELAGQDRERDRLWADETRHPTIVFGLDVPKDELDRRIEARTRAMFEAGVQSGGGAGSRRRSLVDGGLRARARGHRRARRRRSRDRGPRRAHEALRRVPAQVDAEDSGPC